MLRTTLLAMTAGAALVPVPVSAETGSSSYLQEGGDGPGTSYGWVRWFPPGGSSSRDTTFILTEKSLTVGSVDAQNNPIEQRIRVGFTDIAAASAVHDKHADTIRITQRSGRVDDFLFLSGNRYQPDVPYANPKHLRALDDLHVKMTPLALRGEILAKYDRFALKQVPGPDCRAGIRGYLHIATGLEFYIAERELFWYGQVGQLESLPIEEVKDVRPPERHSLDWPLPWQIAVVRSNGSCVLLNLTRTDVSSQQAAAQEARSTILARLAEQQTARPNGEAPK